MQLVGWTTKNWCWRSSGNRLENICYNSAITANKCQKRSNILFLYFCPRNYHIITNHSRIILQGAAGSLSANFTRLTSWILSHVTLPLSSFYIRTRYDIQLDPIIGGFSQLFTIIITTYNSIYIYIHIYINYKLITVNYSIPPLLIIYTCCFSNGGNFTMPKEYGCQELQTAPSEAQAQYVHNMPIDVPSYVHKLILMCP